MTDVQLESLIPAVPKPYFKEIFTRHHSNQRPLRGREEGVTLNVVGTL